MPRDPLHEQTEEIVPSAFEEVGRILAEARKEKGMSVAQVADVIHIRQQYLKDLEEGRLSGFPGIVYIRGFLRTYAHFLGLDGKELIRRLKGLPHLSDQNHKKTPARMRLEDKPTPLILLISGGFVLLMMTAGYLFLNSLPHVPPSLPPQEPFEKSPQGSLPENLSEEKIVEGPPLTLAEIIIPPIPNSEAPSTEAPIVPRTFLSSKKITLKATEPCWIEIRDGNGHVMTMKVLKKDETYVVPEKPGVTINMGNAGGIDVFIGDTKIPSLGKHGEVRRGIRLESLQ